jgi:hypothetical protein
MTKPSSTALHVMDELQNTDATTRHDDKDAINIGRLGVQQELQVHMFQQPRYNRQNHG